MNSFRKSLAGISDFRLSASPLTEGHSLQAIQLIASKRPRRQLHDSTISLHQLLRMKIQRMHRLAYRPKGSSRIFSRCPICHSSSNHHHQISSNSKHPLANSLEGCQQCPITCSNLDKCKLECNLVPNSSPQRCQQIQTFQTCSNNNFKCPRSTRSAKSTTCGHPTCRDSTWT